MHPACIHQSAITCRISQTPWNFLTHMFRIGVVLPKDLHIEHMQETCHCHAHLVGTVPNCIQKLLAISKQNNSCYLQKGGAEDSTPICFAGNPSAVDMNILPTMANGRANQMCNSYQFYKLLGFKVAIRIKEREYIWDPMWTLKNSYEINFDMRLMFR